jgi:hypothetical protein
MASNSRRSCRFGAIFRIFGADILVVFMKIMVVFYSLHVCPWIPGVICFICWIKGLGSTLYLETGSEFTKFFTLKEKQGSYHLDWSQNIIFYHLFPECHPRRMTQLIIN